MSIFGIEIRMGQSSKLTNEARKVNKFLFNAHYFFCKLVKPDYKIQGERKQKGLLGFAKLCHSSSFSIQFLPRFVKQIPVHFAS